MAKGGKSSGTVKNSINETHKRGTSIGNGKIKTSTMNKNKKQNFKKYRGQGRP
jgi:hypothetical protein